MCYDENVYVLYSKHYVIVLTPQCPKYEQNTKSHHQLNSHHDYHLLSVVFCGAPNLAEALPKCPRNL